MKKRKLQEFASWAKVNLESQITVSLKSLGINSDEDIKSASIKGDVTIIDGIERTFPNSFKKEREDLISIIRFLKYSNAIEQFAYTWFNRLIALRFMEVHGYLDHGFKIFPTKTSPLPEILSQLRLAKDVLSIDLEYCEKLKQSNQNETLYKYVLVQQCHVLASALPMIFSKDEAFLKYVSPSPFLFGETIISKLVEIDEEDFKEDVEIIGWLYQFYIAQKKDDVFASKKLITKDTLPAVTQLFTPDWIVRFMTENSLGRIWIESNPTSSLKSKMLYYVEDAIQDEEVQKKLNKLNLTNVDVEQIKVIEPACGSGHILVYAFDLFFEMYKEKGYPIKNIPGLILKNNLIGLDIDLRASQLASFALTMRARSIDSYFFDKERIVSPSVLEIIDSKRILSNKFGKTYKDFLEAINKSQGDDRNSLTKTELDVIENIVSLFENAKVIGSLLKVKPNNYLKIRDKLKEKTQNLLTDIFTNEFLNTDFQDLIKILELAQILSDKYELLITNPPYCGISRLETQPKKYFIQNYPNSKTDMYAMFMETDLVKENGFCSMITMHSWMFLNSFDQLRKILVNTVSFLTMLHLGAHAFEEIGGEVVQTTSFIFRKNIIDFKGKFFRLIDINDSNEKKNIFNQRLNHFLSSNNIFKLFPSTQFVYWIKYEIAEIYSKLPKLSSISNPKSGIMTGKDNLFIRFWHEVSILNTSLYNNSIEKLFEKGLKWFPLTRGGQYRKWYGNLESVVNMQNGGKSISEFPENNYRLRNKDLYFKDCATWTMISSNSLSIRFVPNNVLFGNGGPTIFSENHLFFIMGLLNSKVSDYFIKMLNPTINTIIDDINSIPFKKDKTNKVEILVKENIEISRIDWDLFETSWDFKKHPLIGNGKIHDLFQSYYFESQKRFLKLMQNEIELNLYFINLYGLNEELNPEINEEQISISLPEKLPTIKSLISYLVGIIFGRFSLTEDGLIHAGGTLNSSKYGHYEVDKDGIVPIYTDLSNQNSLTNRIINLIKLIFGEGYYRENIDFIADTLVKKTNETSEETLNRYLLEDFYSDHVKTYQKRPIYWLISSGKNNGFKCLFYLHRYNENTLANVNANYFLPATANLSHQIEELKQKRRLETELRKQLLIDRELEKVNLQLAEARDFGLILDHIANRYISLDLDDGVKVNYSKFQGIEVLTNNGKVKKDLLEPIK